MGLLDDDTRLEQDGPGAWRGEISDRWSVIGPNGGYLATLITRALMETAPFPDPLALNVHFLARTSPGPARIDVEVLREGRSHATLSARLSQGDVVAAALATFGRRRDEGPELCAVSMPAVPPPSECELPTAAPIPGMTLRDRFEIRIPPAGDPRFGGLGEDSPVSGGWRRLVDRELDDLAIPLVMDASAPSVWAVTGQSASAPTVEFTVHWRSVPRTPWHLAWFSTTCLRGGYFIENGELWGEDGQLVAESRQLARFIEA